MKIKWTERTTARTVSLIIVVVVGMTLYFTVNNWDNTVKGMRWFAELFRPFILGFVLAYLLNSPLHFFEDKVFKFVEIKKPHHSLRRVLAIVLTWMATIAVLTFFFWSVIPQVGGSIEMLVRNIPGYFNEIAAIIEKLAMHFNLDVGEIEELFGTKISLQGIIASGTQYFKAMLPVVYSVGVQVGGGLIDVAVGIIVSIYLMFSKELLIAQLKKGLYALAKKSRVDRIVEVGRESHRIFSGFISGKLLDSLIIGVLCFIGMSIMNMDYALLISFVVGVTNVIPFFGPFFGAIPSCLILLIVDPWQALWFGIFVLALQQFDGNILGPKILGDSTGLPALWVLFAIIIGGGIFGVVGMFIGVPAFAVLYGLTRAYFQERLRKKGMPTDTESYIAEENMMK